MSSWPDARDTESNIIQKFKFLQDHLTTETAVDFCEKAPYDGYFKKLHDADHIHYEGALQAYLVCLQTVLPLVSRSQFLRIFARSSPGRNATLEFLHILCLHPILENEVSDLFRELLWDPRGEILHRNDIRQMVIMIWEEHTHRGNLSTFIRFDSNLNRNSAVFKQAQVIGELISSEEFSELMKSNPTTGAQIAHQMMKDLPNDHKPSSQLKELLLKYQKFVSKDKFDK